MNPCERHQMNVSVMLDGELASEDVVATIDHLLSCETCRGFYRGCTDLDHLLQPLRGAGRGEDRGFRPWLVPRSVRARVAAVAAVLVVGLGIGWILQPPSMSTRDGTDTLVVHWAEQRGKMSEDRFLQLTKELLEADPRYQWEMLNVLRQVQRETHTEEDGLALLSYFSDADRGSRPEAENDRGAEPNSVPSTHVY